MRSLKETVCKTPTMTFPMSGLQKAQVTTAMKDLLNNLSRIPTDLYPAAHCFSPKCLAHYLLALNVYIDEHLFFSIKLPGKVSSDRLVHHVLPGETRSEDQAKKYGFEFE